MYVERSKLEYDRQHVACFIFVSLVLDWFLTGCLNGQKTVDECFFAASDGIGALLTDARYFLVEKFVVVVVDV